MTFMCCLFVSLDNMLCLLFVPVLLAATASCLELVDVGIPCNNPTVQLFFKKTGMKNGNILADLNATIPIPMDNEYMVAIAVYVFNKGHWKHVFSPPKRGLCQTMDLYVGSIWHNIQTMNGISPKTCPIIGTFKVHNFEYDLKSIRFPGFPHGLINVTTIITYKNTQKMLSCIHYIVRNV